LLRLDWYSTEAQTGPPSSPNDASGQEESIRDRWKLFWKPVVRELRPCISNSKALASRFIQLSCSPEHLAPIILDFLSLSLSVIWTDRQPGPDLLYPFSSLKKQKSGPLARQFLQHSRDQQLQNLHYASSPRNGVDPPRVAVIDLDEVPPEIIERGYTVSADFYDFAVMVLFLQILISTTLHLFSPLDLSLYYEWFGRWITSWFGAWFGAWVDFYGGLVSSTVFQLIYSNMGICHVYVYAVIRGEGTLTLVRRSDVSTRGCAVLLDRDFTIILTGTQNVVEAIAESSFSMSHSFTRNYKLKLWQLCQYFCYEALKAVCQGLPFAILAGFWLLLRPTSLLTASLPLVPAVAMSFVRARTYTIHVLDYTVQGVHFCSTVPAFLLIFIYELGIVKDPLLRNIIFQPTVFIHLIPLCFLMIHFILSQNFHIRTAKLLDILGHPPVRKWEFDTLAAVATFQCLVLCRDIPRPVKSFDVLTLLDTFVPDQTDVWKVWKARVADRIAHEEDISFAPTVPSFGDDRQIFLKGLLDEAQTGFGMYRDFYDQHVPLYSTIAL
jgi:hypothetical protein